MNRFRSNQKGIMVITLIIIVIVVLVVGILAIKLAMGKSSNDILKKANSSDNRTSNVLGAAKDEINMAVMEAMENYYQKSYESKKKASDDGLDDYIMDNVTKIITNDASIKYENGEVWDRINKKIVLQYSANGATIEGTLSKGKMSWGAINK